MRIAFDGTTLTPGRTGVGYYTEHLLQHVAREVEKTGDELIVISNQPIETAEPLPRHVRVHEQRRFPLRIAWMQFLAARVLEDIRADVAHFTNGMLPLGYWGGAGRDDSRHEPHAVSAVPSAATARHQPPAPWRRRACRRRRRHGLAQCAARSVTAPRRPARARHGRARGGRARLPNRFAIRDAARASAAGTACPSGSSCMSARSSRARTCRG